MRRLLFCIVLSLLTGLTAYPADNAPGVMQRMAMRLFPAKAKSFVFKQVASDKDCFMLQSAGDKILISGNDANSMAVGLNYYLKNYCMTTISWYKSDPVEMPEVLPHITGIVKVQAKVPTRFFLNYCTFGYTMPWWTWKDWERLIDWMALNGVNMPLAITGQEAIWYNVWKKLGLSDNEIRSYFTGPSHLPWHRMCNVDGWQGPLPVDWLEGQKELQKLIVSRERELDMKPVLPAFAGHVPAALKKLYPHAMMTKVSQWGGFTDEKYRCYFLNPMDSLFSVIQKEYLNEQTKLYGTNHIYGVDPFNEVDPPSWKEDSLAMISSHIYQSMKAADKDATWLQMTWVFYYNAKNWTAPRIKAMVRAVPQGRMILLDYFCENVEIWKRSESYFGQPFIWCYLGNFGGNTVTVGPMGTISSRLANTFQNAGKNFKGIGATLEGLDVNQFAYEFTFDKAWDMPQSDALWQQNLADRRLGVKSEAARQAWKIMSEKVLTQRTSTWEGTLIENRPSLTNSANYITNKLLPLSSLDDLIKAWRLLLSVPHAYRDSYKFDVVNIGRQVLGMYFQSLRDKFAAAYQSGNLDSVQVVGALMKDILRDSERLTACHSTFSFKNWINSARAMGKDDAEKDYYEKNARTLLTVWGENKSLIDYARRGWSGLIANYYAPRWNMFIDDVISCMQHHQPFKEDAFTQKCYLFERSFIEPSYKLTFTPSGNAIVVSRVLLNKYFH
jgi:alpha-N-acetylglucosaminidase